LDDRNCGGTSEVDESTNNNNDDNDGGYFGELINIFLFFKENTNISPKNDNKTSTKRLTENGMSSNNEPLPSIPEEDHQQILQQKPTSSSKNFIENEEIPLICLRNRKEEKIKKENKLNSSSNNLCENEISISPLTSHSEFSLLIKVKNIFF